MAVRVQWVRYGQAAAAALHHAIAEAKQGDPLSPVTVVVPSNQVGVAARRLLASGRLGSFGPGSGLAAVTFLTPYRLAELRGAADLAGSGRRPVSTPVVAAAVRAALAAQPGRFEPVATHPATESALVASYRELRELSQAQLGTLEALHAGSADLVRLVRAARARLEPHWYDEQDLMVAAGRRLRTDGPGTLGRVVVHLPQQLTPHMLALLLAVGDVTDVVVLVGTTGDAAADGEVVAAARALQPSVVAPPAVSEPLTGIVEPDRTRMVVTSDADEEVRHAVRQVVDAVRRGARLDRIAILHPTPDPWARLAREQLEAAAIPANGPSVSPLAARVAGRTLLGAFELAERGLRRQDLFAWLASFPARLDGSWAPIGAWERISRSAGVVAGHGQWSRRLSDYAAGRRAEARLLDENPDEPDWKAERARSEADDATGLARFVAELAAELDPERVGSRRWSQHAQWAQQFLRRQLGGPDRRAEWPAEEQRAAERVEAALDRLGALDQVEGPVPLDVFARTVRLELEADLGRSGRFGEGVLVGPLSMGIGLDLDLLVVLGMAEGNLPATVGDDALLPDHDRAHLDGALALRAGAVERQHRQWLAAMAGARRQVLSVPRGDLRRSTERVPSRWLIDVAQRLDGERCSATRLLEASRPWITSVPSFEAGLRRLAFPATGQEYRLSRLLAGHDSLDRTSEPVLSTAVAAVRARRSDQFTRFDGNVAGVVAASPTQRVLSATRVERWVRCPFHAFLSDVLRLQEVEEPEDTYELSALDKGSIIHESLEHFYAEVLRRPGGAPPPSQPWAPADRARLQEIARAACDAAESRGVTGRAVFWHRDRRSILDLLDRFLTVDDRMRARRGATPAAVEQRFDEVEYPLPDGRVLRFRGAIDRIDHCGEGLLVIDYKTGSATRFSVSPDDPHQGGLHVQLPIYALAARQLLQQPRATVDAEFWFIADNASPMQGYPVHADVVDLVGDTLATVVDGMEAGLFIARPDGNSTTPSRFTCPACNPDGLGTTELRRAWERKRHDPAVRPYVDLVEPDAVGADSPEGEARP